MNNNEILEKIRVIMQDYIEEVPETLDESMSLVSDIGMDSFALASMICTIEEKFNITIPDQDLTKFQSLKDLSSYIQDKTK